MIRRFILWLFWLTFGLVALSIPSWSLLNHYFPLPEQHAKPYSVSVVASNGEVLRQFADSQGVFRTDVTPQEVSKLYLDTLLAYEDRRFYRHHGVDWLALIRATFQRLTYGEIVSGGSTITMQVARILYPMEKTYSGKLVQIYRAMQLESVYSKSQLLSLYLTYVPMGGNIEGVEAASQRYLGKSAYNLNISEAALLAVIPQRPSFYRPDRFPERAQKARNKVLRRLIAQGLLTNDSYQLLKGEPVKAGRRAINRKVPLLARELKQRYPGQNSIETYINADLQRNLDSTIRSRFGLKPNGLSVAVLVMENETGKVIAYKGSRDFDDFRSYGHIDMTKAVRSPGSTLKPFVYAAAIEQGLIHSKSLLLDIPLRFGDYTPQNFDKSFSGAISVSEALQRSKNIGPVFLLEKIGIEPFVQKMEVLNTSLNLSDLNLSVVLGGGGSTLRYLVTYYSAFARQGVAIKPRFTVKDSRQEAHLISEPSTWIVKSILETRPADRPILKFGRQVAWKTGTSYGFRDSWAIGTSPDYTVGVWVGRPDGSPYVGQTGALTASPILFDVFDLLPNDKKALNKPDSVESVEICWPSGLNHLVVPEKKCLRKHTALTVDGVTPKTLKKTTTVSEIHNWPQQLQNWHQISSDKVQSLEILFPKDGSYIYSYPNQILKFKASINDVRWFVNDIPIDSSASAGSLKGRNTIKACKSIYCHQITITVH